MHRNKQNNNPGDFTFLDDTCHISSINHINKKNIDLKIVDDKKQEILMDTQYEEITEYELEQILLCLIQIIRNLSYSLSNEALIIKCPKLMNMLYLLFIYSNVNEMIQNLLDILINLAKNIFLNKSPYSSFILYKLYLCLISNNVILSEQSLECFRLLTLPNGNDSYFDSMSTEFLQEIVNLLMNPKSEIRDSALEILYCISDQSVQTKTRLAKIDNCISRLVGLICNVSHDNRISKFAACILGKLSEIPNILNMIMPYEKELVIAACADESISKVLLGIISN